MRLLFTIIIILFSLSCQARPIIADLSLREINIDARFNGTSIIPFGARNDAGDIIIVIRGPKSKYVVRKKENIAGIWINTKQIIFEQGDEFYSIASNRPLNEIKNNSLLKDLGIGLFNLDLPTNNKEYDKKEFQQAFLDYKIDKNLYVPIINKISFFTDTLFKSVIHFPKNIPGGTYIAEIYLFSDGHLAGFQSSPLVVKKTGFSAFVYDFAYENSFLYGIIAILLALIVGWFAGSIFKKVS